MDAGMERVLIPTDFSAWSAAAVARCPEIPGVKEAVLLHVTPPGDPAGSGSDPATMRAEAQLREAARALEGRGIAVSIRVESAHGPSVAKTILAVAAEEKAGMILIGARGAGGIREALLGSVSHDVVRMARQHLLIMHPLRENPGSGTGMAACPLLFADILCPVDLSKVSEETVRLLGTLDRRSWVRLLHAIGKAESAGELALLRDRALARLTALKKEIETHGISPDVTVRMGDPVLLTCTEAERSGSSLILVSRFGRFDYMKNIPIGHTAEAIALRATRPVLIRYPQIPLDVTVRELAPAEFPLAEEVWLRYHQQKADASRDRIYAVFVEGTVAAVARCRRHPDGNEVDGVFVPEEFRDRGYARRVMQELVRARGHETLFMHATLELVSFYKSFGFVPIPEKDLPQGIRERFGFAGGNMEGSDVCPMKRDPGGIAG